MKKILITLTIVISCLGISRVNADENIVYLSSANYHTHSYYQRYYYYIDSYSYLKNAGYSDELEYMYHLLMEKYNNEYKELKPFFYANVDGIIYYEGSSSDITYDNITEICMTFHLFSEIPVPTTNRPFPYSNFWISYVYDTKTSTYTYSINNESSGTTFNIVTSDDSNGYENYIYDELEYFVSNFDIVNPSFMNKTYVISSQGLTINPGDVIEPYYTVDNVFITDHTEINLNDYAYVALSLKDYNKKAFETTIQVKGQYCLTPVYNYGMTERKDILEGTQVDRCSPYYDNYTPIRTYILDNDLKNNAIYYLKSYDTTRDNYIKIDTSVFDVTYVTEENKDNPYVTIGGKTYPTIPYDSLTDTATKSEDEGYVSGAVEEFSFADIFTAPLEFLKDIWSSIASVFDLVKEFFSLLPEPIPTFLLTSFMLAIALGLLKIIL